jgi:hypothetical protein
VYVKGANLGFGLKEMPHRFVYLLALVALIFFGILSIVPEAQSQNAIRLSRQDKHDLIHEASLFFQDRHRSVIDRQPNQRNRKSLPTLFHPPTRSGNGGGRPSRRRSSDYGVEARVQWSHRIDAIFVLHYFCRERLLKSEYFARG